jgi:hypothetical protein
MKRYEHSRKSAKKETHACMRSIDLMIDYWATAHSEMKRSGIELTVRVDAKTTRNSILRDSKESRTRICLTDTSKTAVKNDANIVLSGNFL